jgi:hypothetical protein
LYILTFTILTAGERKKGSAPKTYGTVDVWAHIFLAFASFGGDWSASSLGHFTPDKEPTLPTGYKAGWATEPI